MKKGVSTVISLILIVMVTIAIITASYYWISKIHGQMQSGVKEHEEALTEDMTGLIDVADFLYSVENDNAAVIMRNIGSRDLNSLGRTDDKLIIYNSETSCDMNFNGSICDLCPFDLNVNSNKIIIINFSNTDCSGLDEGLQYTANFAMTETNAHAIFITQA